MNLEIQWPEGMKPLWETPLPISAFDADTINLFALWLTAPQGKVTLIARVDGHSDAVPLATVELSGQCDSEQSLSRVAASQHLNTLDESQAQSLAVTYQLITPHTNFLLVHERAEDEKALDMPDLIKVKQMVPAGWGGVGSTEDQQLSYSRSSLSIKACASYDMDPTDIGTDQLTRRPAIARKHKALEPLSSSSSSRQLNTGGDFLDIPAFLRRAEKKDRLPDIVLGDERPITLVAALLAQPRDAWPQRMRDLQRIGVAPEVIDWLQKESMNPKWQQLTETTIITAFLEALVSMPVFSADPSSGIKTKGSMGQWISRIWPNNSVSGAPINPTLVRYFSKELIAISAQEWPPKISGLLIDVF